MPYLIVDKGFKEYKIVKFDKTLTIGRALNNDLILEGPSNIEVSRKHAFIEKKEDDYILKDTSRNGTLVGDEKIKSIRLIHGTRFRIVKYFFTFIDSVDTVEVSESKLNKSIIPLKKEAASFEDTKTITAPISMDSLKLDKKIQTILRELDIVSVNKKFKTLLLDLQEIAKINVPVLLLGESGTGKEKIARGLHILSCKNEVFIPLNCASIPEGIFESELFGSVKGAYHNSVDKPGKLELANNGSLFLDEIGEMSLSLQPKLLRFLEDKKITRLGDTKTKTLNLRIIAATNRDLQSDVVNKRFREDLYQRLACIKLNIPSLRERLDDIVPLSKFFLAKIASEHGLKQHLLSREAIEILMKYSWPGNVRELNNVLLQAAIKCGDGTIYPKHLIIVSEEDKKAGAEQDDSFLCLEDIEKKHIQEALARVQGNKIKAAKLLGISRSTLYKKLERFDLQ